MISSLATLRRSVEGIQRFCEASLTRNDAKLHGTALRRQRLIQDRATKLHLPEQLIGPARLFGAPPLQAVRPQGLRVQKQHALPHLKPRRHKIRADRRNGVFLLQCPGNGVNLVTVPAKLHKPGAAKPLPQTPSKAPIHSFRNFAVITSTAFLQKETQMHISMDKRRTTKTHRWLPHS